MFIPLAEALTDGAIVGANVGAVDGVKERLTVLLKFLILPPQADK
jgi:hypothetical protein